MANEKLAAASTTKARPSGTRAGGMTPASWQGGEGEGKSKSAQTKCGWPSKGRDGHCGH